VATVDQQEHALLVVSVYYMTTFVIWSAGVTAVWLWCWRPKNRDFWPAI